MVGVFISYSSKDRDLATYLSEQLQANSIDVFIDFARLKAGDSFSEQIRQQLTTREFVVLIVSKRSAQSKWVQAEINLAYSLDKPIIPIVLENIDFNNSKFWFVSHQERVDFTKWDKDVDVSQSLNKLISALTVNTPPTKTETDDKQIIPKVWLDEFPILARFPAVKTMRMLRPVVEGQSGSRVFIVKVDLYDLAVKPMTCFLKIHYSQGNTPLLRHQQAYESFKHNMPRVVDSTPWDSESRQIALLYTAQKTVDSSISLGDLLHSSGKEAYKLIEHTCRAIMEWNQPLDFSTDYQFSPIIELFRRAMSHSDDETIQYRRLEDPDSSVYARLGTHFGLDADHSQIKIDGKREVLPNPLAYLDNEDLWGLAKGKAITWICGHVHGDMNIRNILSLNGSGDSLAVIDFDTYDSANLIFMDYFQLEIGIIFTLLSPTNPANHNELIRLSQYLARHLQLEAIPSLSVISLGINLLIAPIRENLAKFWSEDEDLIASMWMARMVVGLELSRKHKLSREERTFALLYAAESLNSLLTHLRIDSDQYGAPINISWGGE